MIELKGKPVAESLTGKCIEIIAGLKLGGVVPKLAIIRIGNNEADLIYESSITKKFAAAGALTEIIALPAVVIQEDLEKLLLKLNDDGTVHGILLFRPVPGHISEKRLKSIINESKDVDCLGICSIAHVFAGDGEGYSPCTAQAVMELLDQYSIGISGKKVVIIGRSLVVGKPLAMLLLGRNATVTICHTKTTLLANVCKSADILVSCAGAANMVNEKFINPDQIVIDVGINMVEGRICGDVDYGSVADKVKAITPVPGGIGAITTSVLMKHTVQNAVKSEAGVVCR